jgi:DnaJ-class molecular chaperone
MNDTVAAILIVLAFVLVFTWVNTPARRPCRRCNGRGRIYHKKDWGADPCPICNGKGHR